VRRRDLFLEILEQVREKHDFVVAGYVVIAPDREAFFRDAGLEAAGIAMLSREDEKKCEADKRLEKLARTGFLGDSIP
jgi:hypothetical protein